MKNGLVLIVIAFLMMGCGSDSNSVAVDSTASNISIEYTEHGKKTLRATNVGSRLEIACPPGSKCDDYVGERRHSYRDEDVRLLMTFDLGIINNYSLESLNKYFKAFEFILYFPEKSVEGDQVRFSPTEPLRTLGESITLTHTNGMKLVFDRFDNGRLVGSISGTIMTLTHFVLDPNDPACVLDDVRGACFRDETTEMPFTVTFDLNVQQDYDD